MKKYHMQRSEKKIEDRDTLLNVIKNQRYLTMAMAKNQVPYLVTLNYGFNEEKNCFYFHCASEGKKIDYLKANPTVWGQILEDKGYLTGQCDHAYRSIHFKGHVEFLATREAKKQALMQMVNQLEPQPNKVKEQLIDTDSLRDVSVGKIIIEYMTGKANNV